MKRHFVQGRKARSRYHPDWPQRSPLIAGNGASAAPLPARCTAQQRPRRHFRHCAAGFHQPPLAFCGMFRKVSSYASHGNSKNYSKRTANCQRKLREFLHFWV